MVIIGSHSYGNPICRGEMNDVHIHKFVQIGDNCVFDCGFNHAQNISTYPFHAWMEPNRWPNNNITKGDIHIKSDTWVGEGCLFFSGITVGEGCIIGARSIITKDIEPYSVVIGNNILLRKRYVKADITRLLEMQWWNWTIDQIENAVPLLHSGDVDGLYEYYKTHVNI